MHRCWCHTQGALVSVFTNTSDLMLATQQCGRHCPCPAKMAEGRWTRSCTRMYTVQDEQKQFLWTIQKRKLQVWKLTRDLPLRKSSVHLWRWASHLQAEPNAYSSNRRPSMGLCEGTRTTCNWTFPLQHPPEARQGKFPKYVYSHQSCDLAQPNLNKNTLFFFCQHLVGWERKGRPFTVATL